MRLLLPLPLPPLPQAECTLMTLTHSLGHASAASILLPCQAAAGETALRQVTSPRGGRLRAPDATLGVGMFGSPKASCGAPLPRGRRPRCCWSSPPPLAALPAPPPALRPAPHLHRRSPRAPVSKKPAARPPALLQGSVTSGMHCPLIVNPIIVIK